MCGCHHVLVRDQDPVTCFPVCCLLASLGSETYNKFTFKTSYDTNCVYCDVTVCYSTNTLEQSVTTGFSIVHLSVIERVRAIINKQWTAWMEADETGELLYA